MIFVKDKTSLLQTSLLRHSPKRHSHKTELNIYDLILDGDVSFHFKKSKFEQFISLRKVNSDFGMKGRRSLT